MVSSSQPRGGGLDGFHDSLVSGTSAKVAFHPSQDIRAGRMGVPGEKAVCLHDHARRAVAALESPPLGKLLLKGVQFVSLGQALDGEDFGALQT
jgi:hypothetical protein